MIEMKLNIYCTKTNRHLNSHRPNFFKGDYDKINQFLKNQPWENILTKETNIDLIYSKFIDILQQSIQKFVPKSSPGIKPKLPPHITRIL